MSILCGYPVPGKPRGQAFTLPDFCHGLVNESHANRIADDLRQSLGAEPTWQSVRGRLIRIARARMANGFTRTTQTIGA